MSAPLTARTDEDGWELAPTARELLDQALALGLWRKTGPCHKCGRPSAYRLPASLDPDPNVAVPLCAVCHPAWSLEGREPLRPLPLPVTKKRRWTL